MAPTQVTATHLLVLAGLLLPACLSLSSSSTLTPTDRERLRKVLEPGWQLKDLSLVMYAASGYKHLGLTVPDAKVCLIPTKISIQTTYGYLAIGWHFSFII